MRINCQSLNALVVDGSGNVSVTGSAWNGGSLDYPTLQYDDAGTLLLVDTTDDDTLHRISMTFEGSSDDKQLLPLDKETYWNNYYLGHIPEGRPFVPLHARTMLQDVWPNIDVVYSSNQRGLKYYIVVHPGGETGAIALKYHGYEDLHVDGNDALVIESSIGEVVQPQALAYTMDGNGELSLLGWQPDYDVASGVVTLDGFGSWSGDLVIEVNWGYRESDAIEAPHWWSTYLTGVNTGNDFVYDITTDANSNMYTVGVTSCTDFSVFGGLVIQSQISGGKDAFIGQFNSLYHREWLSYFGGNGNAFGSSPNISDVVGGVVCDDNHVYLGGGTYSTSNFPRRRPFSQSYLHIPPNTHPYDPGFSGGFLAQLQSNGVIVSTEANQYTSNLVVFPNPGNGKFTLEWKAEKAEKVVVTTVNVIGNSVRLGNAMGYPGTNILEIDLSNEPCGMYIISLIGKTIRESTKVVKQ